MLFSQEVHHSDGKAKSLRRKVLAQTESRNISALQRSSHAHYSCPLWVSVLEKYNCSHTFYVWLGVLSFPKYYLFDNKYCL